MEDGPDGTSSMKNIKDLPKRLHVENVSQQSKSIGYGKKEEETNQCVCRDETTNETKEKLALNLPYQLESLLN